MSHFVGRDILTTGMNEYFTKFALKNTCLKDFIECLQNAAKGKIDVHEWTDSWLTKAGANEILAHWDESNKVKVE
jgi:aminopeptidase N